MIQEAVNEDAFAVIVTAVGILTVVIAMAMVFAVNAAEAANVEAVTADES